MNLQKLQNTQALCRELLKLVNELEKDAKTHKYWDYTSAVLRASVKRKSMDLTRSLAELRKSN